MENEPDARNLHTTLRFTHQPFVAVGSQSLGERILVDHAKHRYGKTAYLYFHDARVWYCHATHAQSFPRQGGQYVAVDLDFTKFGKVVSEYSTHSAATLLCAYGSLGMYTSRKDAVRNAASVAVHAVPGVHDLLTGARHAIAAYGQGCTSIDFGIASIAGITSFDYPAPDNKQNWNIWKDLLRPRSAPFYASLYQDCVDDALRMIFRKNVADCMDAIQIMIDALEGIVPGTTIFYHDVDGESAHLRRFIACPK